MQHYYLIHIFKYGSIIQNYTTTLRSIQLSSEFEKSKYLPASGAVAVSLVFEIRDTLHHPVIDLRQGKALLWGALDGLRDEISVRHIPPGIAARRAALTLSRSGSGRRHRRGGTDRGGEQGHLLLVGNLRARQLLLLLLMWVSLDTVLLTREVTANAHWLLVGVVFILFQQAEIVDVVSIIGRLLLDGGSRRGCVGVGWVAEIRPWQGPST